MIGGGGGLCFFCAWIQDLECGLAAEVEGSDDEGGEEDGEEQDAGEDGVKQDEGWALGGWVVLFGCGWQDVGFGARVSHWD